MTKQNSSEEKNKEQLPNLEDKATLKSLMLENLALSNELRGMLKRVHRYVIWQRIMAILKIAFIVALFIAAYIYLPPFFGEFMGKINSVYSDISNLGN